ncbi:MAG: hypothetical protein HYT16_01455 [DPANN group archaeon]|nr:hypothetical protein [DPANN group archaeon]
MLKNLISNTSLLARVDELSGHAHDLRHQYNIFLPEVFDVELGPKLAARVPWLAELESGLQEQLQTVVKRMPFQENIVYVYLGKSEKQYPTALPRVKLSVPFFLDHYALAVAIRELSLAGKPAPKMAEMATGVLALPIAEFDGEQYAVYVIRGKQAEYIAGILQSGVSAGMREAELAHEKPFEGTLRKYLAAYTGLPSSNIKLSARGFTGSTWWGDTALEYIVETKTQAGEVVKDFAALAGKAGGYINMNMPVPIQKFSEFGPILDLGQPPKKNTRAFGVPVSKLREFFVGAEARSYLASYHRAITARYILENNL